MIQKTEFISFFLQNLYIFHTEFISIIIFFLSIFLFLLFFLNFVCPYGTVDNSISSRERSVYCRWCYSYWTLCYDHTRHQINGLLLKKLHIIFSNTKSNGRKKDHWVMIDYAYLLHNSLHVPIPLPSSQPQSYARMKCWCGHKVEDKKEASAVMITL